MPTCVVIQPFDDGKFDKRFEDTYKPALEEAGLEVYRVDRDPSADVPIEAIEERIRDASICFADITTDNPNVWYELGFAFASGCFTIIVCSAERKLPFNIQHQNVIKYKSDSKTDFEDLSKKITERAGKLRKRSELRQFAASEQVAPREGLSQIEIQALAAIASATNVPGGETSVHFVMTSLKQSLTGLGFGLALRRLEKKDFVEFGSGKYYTGEPFRTVVVTDHGWDWIGDNESLFSTTSKGESDPGDVGDDIPPPLTEDDIPF